MGVVHARVVDDFQEVRNVQISENCNANRIHIFPKFQQKTNVTCFYLFIGMLVMSTLVAVC
jgi:hypothetical protein